MSNDNSDICKYIILITQTSLQLAGHDKNSFKQFCILLAAAGLSLSDGRRNNFMLLSIEDYGSI